jgi:hypothetical protein
MNSPPALATGSEMGNEVFKETLKLKEMVNAVVVRRWRRWRRLLRCLLGGRHGGCG